MLLTALSNSIKLVNAEIDWLKDYLRWTNMFNLKYTAWWNNVLKWWISDSLNDTELSCLLDRVGAVSESGMLLRALCRFIVIGTCSCTRCLSQGPRRHYDRCRWSNQDVSLRGLADWRASSFE